MVRLRTPLAAKRGDQDEAFVGPDVVYLDGRFKQRVYIVPSKELVVSVWQNRPEAGMKAVW